MVTADTKLSVSLSQEEALVLYKWLASLDKANQTPTSLGPVGGRIVAETLIGLMLADSHSFLNQSPKWQPTVLSQVAGTFTMGDFVKYALKL